MLVGGAGVADVTLAATVRRAGWSVVRETRERNGIRVAGIHDSGGTGMPRALDARRTWHRRTLASGIGAVRTRPVVDNKEDAEA